MSKDIVDELFEIIEKHGEGTSEGAIYWESWNTRDGIIIKGRL